MHSLQPREARLSVRKKKSIGTKDVKQTADRRFHRAWHERRQMSPRLRKKKWSFLYGQCGLDMKKNQFLLRIPLCVCVNLIVRYRYRSLDTHASTYTTALVSCLYISLCMNKWNEQGRDVQRSGRFISIEYLYVRSTVSHDDHFALHRVAGMETPIHNI